MHKMMTLLLAAAMTIGATGCAPKHVVKNWEAASGSRADATVSVGFIYNPAREIPDQSEAQAREVAIRRCQAWGYSDAEPFGLTENKCQQFVNDPFMGMTCINMFVSRTYQCLGNNEPQNKATKN